MSSIPTTEERFQGVIEEMIDVSKATYQLLGAPEAATACHDIHMAIIGELLEDVAPLISPANKKAFTTLLTQYA